MKSSGRSIQNGKKVSQCLPEALLGKKCRIVLQPLGDLLGPLRESLVGIAILSFLVSCDGRGAKMFKNCIPAQTFLSMWKQCAHLVESAQPLGACKSAAGIPIATVRLMVVGEIKTPRAGYALLK